MLIVLIASIVCFAGVVAAQQPLQPGERPPPAGTPPKRPNLIQMLGLSPDQIQQVRRINQARKPQMEAATKRLREATQALDEAIYADSVDDAQFQVRLKDMQAAQAEVARLRFSNELQIRKILTPDQLTRFRDLRRQFQKAAAEANAPDQRRNPLPLRRLRRPQPAIGNK
jgi:Spy/CpxP family protein refolding chaperone